ncbi:hypothetical protein PUW79_05110 [Microbacterium sp. NE2HP2]|uniref:hypothetical protein n=1 Tax=Microbacterium plantarum TaxID=1816425 RepID=UPI002366A374|nr:hypothetical protein [Microbacterium plantarum]MDD7944003.1 hypothetical protein [Microbacterium plantarum]
MTSRTGTRALKLLFAFVAAVLWAGALLAPSFGRSIIALHALAVTVILAGVVVRHSWREPRRHDDLLRA